MDWVMKLPLSDGYNSILTITNHNCSKTVVLLPCKEAMMSEDLARLYTERVFPHYGLPDKIISDQDPKITSDCSCNLCAALGIKQNISSAYHPQTNGQLERTNQSMEAVLRTLCNVQGNDWVWWLPVIAYTLNSRPNATTKQTPYEVLLGLLPKAHQILHQSHFSSTMECLEAVKLIRKQVEENILCA
jgi:transposase InsO family protein